MAGWGGREREKTLVRKRERGEKGGKKEWKRKIQCY